VIGIAPTPPALRFPGSRKKSTWIGALLISAVPAFAFAQEGEAEPERAGPPERVDFETDTDGDGAPDRWYNLRDAELVEEGGIDGPTLLRFEADRPSRPARASLGFRLDGRATEAIEIGLWVRGRDILPGERLGEEPQILFDLLDAELISTARPRIGPWLDLPEDRWVHWVERIAVPPATRDALMTVGLLGATGRLEVDGLTIKTIPAGGARRSNLVLNGGFEDGGLVPSHWTVDGAAERIHPGRDSISGLMLSQAGDRAFIPLGAPLEGVERLFVTIAARGEGLRGGGGAQGGVYFFDADGDSLPGDAGARPVVRWSGRFPWTVERGFAAVPEGAATAVLALQKSNRAGRLFVDHVEVLAEANPLTGAITWRPYHVAEESQDWIPYAPAEAVEDGSALDFSPRLDTPAGRRGFVTVQDGRLVFEDGTPARFFGVSLLPPLATADAETVEALADRLAKSGVNLVRVGQIDAPLGPGSSLIDDVRDDTAAIDPLALRNFDQLIATFKNKGISIALELQGAARFRAEDGIEGYRELPLGGGPAAAFDPVIRERATQVAAQLLEHENTVTGLTLADEPAIAWITLAGELSLFDLIDDPDALPEVQAEALRRRARQSRLGVGRTFWKRTEAGQWSALADGLRRMGVRVPIAGSSHWRREPEFVEAQAAESLDLIDDRLYWSPPRFAAPDRRSLLRRPGAELLELANRKRQPDQPYVVGEYASHTEGAWALPFEGADLLMTALLGRSEGWDALVRRGIGPYPKAWGASAPGTGGGPDTHRFPEIINANPQVFGLLPQASALFRGDATNDTRPWSRAWDRRLDALAIDTPETQGAAGWLGGRIARLADLSVTIDTDFGIVVATSIDGRPIADSNRLLVTAIARVEPSGHRWVSARKIEVADPGRPPLRFEPFQAAITWRRTEPIAAYRLDAAGRRVEELAIERAEDGATVDLDGATGSIHWELRVDSD